ncbi:MAG: c-type cytochrome biogenesis protein CcmI/CycH [Cognaticolwellia sp.]
MKKLSLFASVILLTFWLSPIAQAQEQVAEKANRIITVQVNIKPELMPNDAQEWVLYVYAAKPGERLPLANFKGKLSQLPSEIVLHQSMYLLPNLTLQQAQNVVIVAKATKSKNPHKKSADDIIGYSTQVNFDNGAHQSVSMIIDQHDKSQPTK